jgi:Ni/Co efflux regulator RcnB
MKRILVAALLGLLLPGLTFAQPNQPGAQGRQGARPAAPANRPGPGRPQGPARPQTAERTPAARPPAARPAQAGRSPRRVAQPLPPRGNQFWHRGTYRPRIRGPAFRYPPGWGYRRWTIGARLPALFLAPAYFFTGWAAIGLQAPPPGYAWVRYGPDLLEVNLSTGQVEDVVYGVFY